MFLSLGLGNAALTLLGASRYSWLIVLGAFMLVSWVAESWATNGASMTKQYAGLSLFASVALLFWYVLRILMSLRRN